ncbi:hypothetical protein ACFZBE_19665 [Streptomyces sp. NPDC008061]|uniref:aromatic-ring hydroxylase C-terminal domain-containing protein n=1 Tax=Streptomyces sp. NPDC008061 TaxID=3364805 RepID=UPI0036EB00FD
MAAPAFAPDMELHTPAGTVPLAGLTGTARPLLLDMTEDASVAGELARWHDQVDIVIAEDRSPAPAATALLLRPDCYVASASDSPRPDAADLDALRTATQRWFGDAEPPATARKPYERREGR